MNKIHLLYSSKSFYSKSNPSESLLNSELSLSFFSIHIFSVIKNVGIIALLKTVFQYHHKYFLPSHGHSFCHFWSWQDFSKRFLDNNQSLFDRNYKMPSTVKDRSEHWEGIDRDPTSIHIYCCQLHNQLKQPGLQHKLPINQELIKHKQSCYHSPVDGMVYGKGVLSKSVHVNNETSSEELS